ncbi:MAG TPA: hypothetical protein PKA41_14855 [Verrucomicrobiota bacterium]|nr:hypothetical protein [Verrucomicrobiota bacterium]
MKQSKTTSRGVTSACWLSLFFLIHTFTPCSGESYWDGLVNYNPPIPMWGGTEAGNAGLPVSGFELRSEGTTNGYAQITFQVSSIMMLFSRPNNIPTQEVKTVAQLKQLIDSKFQNDPRATNYSSALIKFDGRDAVSSTCPISNEGPVKWYHDVTFFWRQEPVWLRSGIFSVHVTAEKRATFEELVASLKTIKIRSTPPPVKLANDAMRLGISQHEARKLCGEPLHVSGPNETYITQKYLIDVCYDGASSDKSGLISYAKVRDPQSAAAVQSREALAAQIQPLATSEAQAILERHTDQGKLKWTSAGDKRWRRSDGAMAALTKNGLTIATAEMWPRLRFNE